MRVFREPNLNKKMEVKTGGESASETIKNEFYAPPKWGVLRDRPSITGQPSPMAGRSGLALRDLNGGLNMT